MTAPGGRNRVAVTHDEEKGRREGFTGTPWGRLCHDPRASEGRVCAWHPCPAKVTGVPEKVTQPRGTVGADAGGWSPTPDDEPAAGTSAWGL